MSRKTHLIIALLVSMVSSFGLLAQNRTVTGVVQDSNGAPLMGAGEPGRYIQPVSTLRIRGT